MHIQPYLYFNGRCDEAIEFYKEALGAKVNFLMRFKDCPPSAAEGIDPAMAEKVMHATLGISGSVIFVSDGQCKGGAKFEGFSLSLNPATESEARQVFEALGDGGTVFMPLAKTFFSPCFGMVTDRFGVIWMVNTGGN